jgi:hypothetical protein
MARRRNEARELLATAYNLAKVDRCNSADDLFRAAARLDEKKPSGVRPGKFREVLSAIRACKRRTKMT